MAAVALELLTRPPESEDEVTIDAGDEFDQNAVEFIPDTDNVLKACSCSASSDQVY